MSNASESAADFGTTSAKQLKGTSIAAVSELPAESVYASQNSGKRRSQVPLIGPKPRFGDPFTKGVKRNMPFVA